MGEAQGAQNAQPGAKTEPNREHAAHALAGHGLRFFDHDMPVTDIGLQQGGHARQVVFVACATTGWHGERRDIVHGYQSAVRVQDGDRALVARIDAEPVVRHP
jgi:hypothetical protein